MAASNSYPKRARKPPVLLIGCCDSRVPPEVVFDAGPGEMFVVRNVANLIPPYGSDDPLPETASAIEYAVLALNVAHIVVMGHAQCGGIRAFARAQRRSSSRSRRRTSSASGSRW